MSEKVYRIIIGQSSKEIEVLKEDISVDPSSLSTITPDHFPESLLPDIIEHLKGAQFVFVVTVDQDDNLWYGSVGHRKKDVLWGIECIRQDLFKED